MWLGSEELVWGINLSMYLEIGVIFMRLKKVYIDFS